MQKKYIIIFLVIATIVAGIIIGALIGKKNNTSNIEPDIETRLAKQNVEKNLEVIETSSMEQKTSPNTLFIFQTFFKDCKHSTTKRIEVPKECINQTEEELSKKYSDWKIQEFSPSQVVFYQEKAGICAEHYIIRENNGYVAIYTIDELGKETLKETTEIVTAYLPETDKIRLQEGIKVIGQENLNATIEDYE